MRPRSQERAWFQSLQPPMRAGSSLGLGKEGNRTAQKARVPGDSGGPDLASGLAQ